MSFLEVENRKEKEMAYANDAQAAYGQDMSAEAQKPGMGEQFADMAKKKAMESALTAGTGAITGGAGAGAMAGIGTAMPYVGAGILAGKALGFFNEGGQVGPLSPQYASKGAGVDTLQSYLGRNPMSIAGALETEYNNRNQKAREENDRGREAHYSQKPTSFDTMNRIINEFSDTRESEMRRQQLFNQGFVKDYSNIMKQMPAGYSSGGPISPQYHAKGTMTEEQARALMNNQPEPTPMPMMRPDPRELMAEIKQEMATPQPISRPASINPYDAAMNYEGYDPIQPAPTNLPQYKFGGGPLGMGVLNMYQDMMKKNMR
jgi:hypothetical protein